MPHGKSPKASLEEEVEPASSKRCRNDLRNDNFSYKKAKVKEELAGVLALLQPQEVPLNRVKQEEHVEEELVCELVESNGTKEKFLAKTYVIQKTLIMKNSKSRYNRNKKCENKLLWGCWRAMNMISN